MAVCSRPAQARLVNYRVPRKTSWETPRTVIGVMPAPPTQVHPCRYFSRSTTCIILRTKTRSLVFQTLSHIPAPTISTKSVNKLHTFFCTALIQVPSHQAFELGTAVFEQVHAVELPVPFVLCRPCRPSEGRGGRVDALDLADDRGGVR